MVVKISVKFDERKRRRLIRRGREGPFVDPFTLVTSDPTAAASGLIRPQRLTVDASNPSPGGNERLGLFVTLDELVLWNQRARGLATNNFHSLGDEFTNSPGDWDRIVDNRNSYMGNPGNHDWQGLTEGWPSPILNGSGNHNVPQRDDAGNIEYVRDAAFWAMTLGSVHLDAGDRTITAVARDAVLDQIEATITSIRTSQYNDFGNRTRWNPDNAGGGFNPAYPLSFYISKIIMAYDYCQVANPDAWSSANKEAFIEWLWDLEPWYGDGGADAVIRKRRDGQTNLTTGIATAAGATAWNNGLFWGGGPAELTVSHKLDNHTPVMTSMLTMIALLAELEEERSGVTTLNATAITKGKEYTRWMAKSYLQNEFFAQAAGNNGGNGTGNRAGTGQFYRGINSTPEDGWKYSLTWLAKVLTGVDALARAGDNSSYELSYTTGVGGTGGGVDTSGSVLSDSYFSNPGPKTFHRAVQQHMRYIIETGTDSHPWRFNHPTSTAVGNRIDSQAPGLIRSEEFILAHCFLRFNDPLLADIYTRAAAGAPAHPANPHSGRYYVTMGVSGMFAGAMFQWGLAEGLVDPYDV